MVRQYKAIQKRSILKRNAAILKAEIQHLIKNIVYMSGIHIILSIVCKLDSSFSKLMWLDCGDFKMCIFYRNRDYTYWKLEIFQIVSVVFSFA